MRWLFLLLVMLNLMLGLYHLNKPPTIASITPGASEPARELDIKLLSEARALVPRPPVAVQDAENACLYLGGFDEETIALDVQQRLLSLDLDARVESVDEAAGVDYWVYMPPLVSRQASLRQLRELQSRNIDSYIITVGDLSNGISLGIFSRRDSAESVVKRLQLVGYLVSIRELPRTHRRYWVAVEGASQRLLTEALLAELIVDFPGLGHRQMPCAGVASLKDFT